MKTQTELRAWRLAQNLIQSDVAARLGVSVSRVSELETGGTCSIALAAAIEDLTDGLVTAAVIWRDHKTIEQLRLSAGNEAA